MRCLMSIGLLATATAVLPLAAQERIAVEASAPSAVSVTIYRDPDRSEGDELERDDPGGFAVISETRSVTLPAGESRVRFEGVSEGMVAITAIVSGLPGSTIEQNRNAELLSPAALVDGTLGNRVTITRTNPATGVADSESAIVRTRADGGLVLETAEGFEAVRCSGLPEKLSFDRVPEGLSAGPIFSIDTRSPRGGTYDVTLTYLSWGFDWAANYVSTLANPLRTSSRGNGMFDMAMTGWLTLVNDNGQSFPEASLQVVAGRLNVESDYEELADPPSGRALRLTCYPLGSSAAGSTMAVPPPPPPMAPPAPTANYSDQAIIVTGARRRESFSEVAIAVTATEEALGDLKLYRMPEPVTVAAKGSKQVAFFQSSAIDTRFVYRAHCDFNDEYQSQPDRSDFESTDLLLVFENDRKSGLGRALPQGGLAVFEPSSFGEQLVATTRLRDYASGQEVELPLIESSSVFVHCGYIGEDDPTERGRKFTSVRARMSNANPEQVRVRLDLGFVDEWDVRGLRDTTVKNGKRISDVTIAGNSEATIAFRVRDPNYDQN